ncbi:MAG: acyl-CoA thioesterase, partial [Burkholderiales bacterium]
PAASVRARASHCAADRTPSAPRMQTSIVPVRVIYADVDRMNVVHHANYFRFFESARTEFIRRRGASYAEVEASGVILPIVDVQVRYLAPARYDDLLHVRVTVTELSRNTGSSTPNSKRMPLSRACRTV